MAHNKRLSVLLDRFVQYNVRINDKKCKFGVIRINCLGFVLDTNGIKPDPERLAPLLRAKSPSNVNQLRSVIGAIQYYSRFIARFAERASSLFELFRVRSLHGVKSMRRLCDHSLRSLHRKQYFVDFQ